MKTIYKTKLHYRGFWCNSVCGLEIYQKNTTIIVVFTELDDNPGTSITNMIEYLATIVKNMFLKNIPLNGLSGLNTIHQIRMWSGGKLMTRWTSV